MRAEAWRYACHSVVVRSIFGPNTSHIMGPKSATTGQDACTECIALHQTRYNSSFPGATTWTQGELESK